MNSQVGSKLGMEHGDEKIPFPRHDRLAFTACQNFYLSASFKKPIFNLHFWRTDKYTGKRFFTQYGSI